MQLQVAMVAALYSNTTRLGSVASSTVSSGQVVKSGQQQCRSFSHGLSLCILPMVGPCRTTSRDSSNIRQS